MVISGPGGKIIHLPDESLLPIARDAIKEMWASLQISHHSDSILQVFASLTEAGIDHGSEVLIRLSEDGVGTYKLPKSGSRKRFSHADYAKLIGYGVDETSEAYKTALEKLKKSGFSERDLHGGFLLVKSQMKNPKKNGVFELFVEEGQKDNQLCDAFTATLYQYPDDKASVPSVVFPPASGDKNKLAVTDEITEVPSMSQMMKRSILNGAQTPAVMFDLIAQLKALGEDVSNLDDEGSDEASDSEEETETKAETKPSTSQGKKSAARSLIDE